MDLRERLRADRPIAFLVEARPLVEVFGLNYQEASDVLGIAVGTVKSRMFRARKALCAAIADDERGEPADHEPGEEGAR